MVSSVRLHPWSFDVEYYKSVFAKYNVPYVNFDPSYADCPDYHSLTQRQRHLLHFADFTAPLAPDGPEETIDMSELRLRAGNQSIKFRWVHTGAYGSNTGPHSCPSPGMPNAGTAPREMGRWVSWAHVKVGVGGQSSNINLGLH